MQRPGAPEEVALRERDARLDEDVALGGFLHAFGEHLDAELLRELGKRDFQSHDLAVGCATDMIEDGSRGARWVAKDALRELQTLVAVPHRRRLLTSKSKMGAKQTKDGS